MQTHGEETIYIFEGNFAHWHSNDYFLPAQVLENPLTNFIHQHDLRMTMTGGNLLFAETMKLVICAFSMTYKWCLCHDRILTKEFPYTVPFLCSNEKTGTSSKNLCPLDLLTYHGPSHRRKYLVLVFVSNKSWDCIITATEPNQYTNSLNSDRLSFLFDDIGRDVSLANQEIIHL